MRAYQTHEFSRLARKAGVTDKKLREAVRKIKEGKIDADLGSHLIKQRVSQGRGGRSGSHRAIIAHKVGTRIVFLHLFAKRDQDNLTDAEEEAYSKAGKLLASLTDEAVEKLLKTKKWIEIEDYEEPEGVPE